MVKKFRPITPGQRHLVLPSRDQLTRDEGGCATVKPAKQLVKGRRRSSGRNHHGHITSRRRGGGAKRRQRLIDFKRDKDGIEALVASIEYDPNRSAFIALLHYGDGEKHYIIAAAGMTQGDRVISGVKGRVGPGCALTLDQMPLGVAVHNIELEPGRGGKLVRSAGLSAQLVARSGGYVTLRMPSGEVRLVHAGCKATCGVVSNAEHALRVEGKAGRMRYRGVRPTVRGTAMNPVDHPHGGGEGRHNGYIPQTPWGKPTKGMRTRSKQKSNRWIVKDRRKK